MHPRIDLLVGPVLGEGDGSYSAVVAAPGREAGNRSVLTGARTSATVGSYLRGGADFQFARSFTIGVDAGYNWVADFAQPVGVRKNYSGFGIPAHVVTFDDQVAREAAIIENLQRQDVHPLEEAEAYERLMAADPLVTADTIAAKVEERLGGAFGGQRQRGAHGGPVPMMRRAGGGG